MEYRRLGHSGLQVSAIGLGTNNFGPRIDYPAAERVLRQAVDVGINFIETSNTYGAGQAEARDWCWWGWCDVPPPGHFVPSPGHIGQIPFVPPPGHWDQPWKWWK